MALGWFLSFLAVYPWAAILKAIVCATDHIAWAGVQTAASSGAAGEGEIAVLQPSPAFTPTKSSLEKALVT